MRRIIGGVLAVSMGAVVAVGVPGAASAAVRNLGSGSCGFGSVSTQANANYNVSHHVYAPNLGPASRTFESASSTPRWTRFYPATQLGQRVANVSSGSISNAGTISDAGYFCDS